MKKRTIYANQSQELLGIFERAGNSAKVLCVPIDYAKKDHVVMFCNGYGDILRKPFPVKNTPEGIKYLIDQVSRSCRHHKIDEKHVFFGGEDVGSYAQNFATTLRSGGWLVAGINARDAKKQRANMQASTDRLDLMGIATMMLNRRGNCSPAQSGIYLNLRTLVRHRRKLVVMTTEVRNRIHAIVAVGSGSDQAIMLKFKANLPKNIHFDALDQYFHTRKCPRKALEILSVHSFRPFPLLHVLSP